MRYLIDSDWLIDHLAGDASAERLLSSLADDGIAMSIISYVELYEGILRSPTRSATAALLAALLRTTPILPFSRPVAESCAAIRDDLRRRNRRVRPRALDLQIAATAMTYGLTLVTRNTVDYRDIVNLQLYNLP